MPLPMPPEPDETFTRKQIQERFQTLFKRPMTAKERDCLFLPPEKEDEFLATRVSPIKQEE
jgi:hypothetical protein